jgi:Transposase DDE domain
VALPAARFAALVRGVSADAALAQGGLFRVAGRGRAVAAARVGGRKSQPTAVVIDSRTLQSTPESGARAGYDGAKRRKGSKVHIAVDTLGHLLALTVTPADQGDREQVAALAEEVQQVTGGTVDWPMETRVTKAIEAFVAKKMDATGLFTELKKRPAGALLVVVK